MAAGFEKAGDFLCGTKVVTDIAMMVSDKADNLMSWQAVASEEKAYKSVYTRRVQSFYKDIVKHGIRTDVIGTKKALEEYKLLITPYMLTLEMEDLPERIEKWVREGGTWLVGPMTDIRNTVGAHYTDRETGILERLTGAVLTDLISDYEHKLTCSWKDGSEFLANKWLEFFEIPEEADALVLATGAYYSSLKGKTVAFHKRVGKGNIIVLGTIPSTQDMQRLLDVVLEISGAQHFEVNGTATVAYRAGEAGEGYAIAAYTDETVTMRLSGTYTDLLTDRIYMDEIELAPYQVAVLKKE